MMLIILFWFHGCVARPRSPGALIIVMGLERLERDSEGGFACLQFLVGSCGAWAKSDEAFVYTCHIQLDLRVGHGKKWQRGSRQKQHAHACRHVGLRCVKAR